MQITISIVDTDGKILRTIECPETMADMQANTGEVVVLQDSNDVTHWFDMADIDNPVRMDKIAVPHTVTDNLISGLPGDELQVEVSGPISDRFTIPAGETELTFTADVPGQYRLSLSGVKYLPTEVQVAV